MFRIKERISTLCGDAGSRRLLLATILVTGSALASSGCTPSPTNSNAGSNTNANVSLGANTNSSATTSGDAPLTIKEPEAYSLSMTISAQGTANERQGGFSPQPIEFARRSGDRRWSVQLPQPVGAVTYLEKAGLKYLIIPGRNQYVELSPEELGFNLGSTMTPTAIIEQLKPRTQHENLGTETVNGRAATKYRFAGSADTRTQAGTVAADSFVYVDEQSGIPLRADLNLNSTSGATARIAIETRDIQLTPDPQLFEVPTGMRKVTAAELKQQVQGFINFIRVIAPILGQMGGQAPASQPSTVVNANRPATNSNANR